MSKIECVNLIYITLQVNHEDIFGIFSLWNLFRAACIALKKIDLKPAEQENGCEDLNVVK